MDTRNSHIVKLLTLGDRGVGKTSILSRFAKDTFTENPSVTIGVDFHIKQVQTNDGTLVTLQIWDIHQQERSVPKLYFRNANGILLVFDVTNQDSFDQIKELMKLVRETCDCAETVIVLVGNKIDLDKRVVSKEMGEELSKELQVRYFETSAKSNIGIDNVFMYLAFEIGKKDLSSTIKLGKSQGIIRQGCCGNSYEDKSVKRNLVLKKPVILFYGYEKGTEITLRLKLRKDVLMFSTLYPSPDSMSLPENEIRWEIKYIDQQRIQKNGKEYPYLFWESNFLIPPCEVFSFSSQKWLCLKSESVAEELDSILQNIGLNYQERCDMISYWLPSLTTAAYVNITFIDQTFLDDLMPLTVEPSPKRFLRVLMLFQVSENENTQSDYSVLSNFPQFDRTEDEPLIVEWGGIEIK